MKYNMDRRGQNYSRNVYKGNRSGPLDKEELELETFQFLKKEKEHRGH